MEHTITITLTVEEWAKVMASLRVLARVDNEAADILGKESLIDDADRALALERKIREAGKQ